MQKTLDADMCVCALWFDFFLFLVALQVAPAPPVSSIQQIREARLQPLKIALQDAIALHTKATGVREALEVEVSGNRIVYLSWSSNVPWHT